MSIEMARKAVHTNAFLLFNHHITYRVCMYSIGGGNSEIAGLGTVLLVLIF